MFMLTRSLLRPGTLHFLLRRDPDQGSVLVLSTVVAGNPGVSHYGIRVQTSAGGGQPSYILAHPSGQQPAFLSIGGLIDFYQVCRPHD